MCLLTTTSKPYNNSGIRYKILRVGDAHIPDKAGKIFSMYQHTRWVNGKLSARGQKKLVTTRYSDSILHEGIHVFNKLKDALHCFKACNESAIQILDPDHLILVKVKVKGFLGAGVHYNYSDFGDGLTGEVWRHAKICEILKSNKNKNPYRGIEDIPKKLIWLNKKHTLPGF